MTMPLDKALVEKTASEALSAISVLDGPVVNARGPLHRVMSDVGFPILSQAGALLGRMSYQVIFDRQLGPTKESSKGVGHPVVNWLFCEWNDRKLDGDDTETMLLAVGTLSVEMEVAVQVAGKAAVHDQRFVSFHEAAWIGREGKVFLREKDMSEAELVSAITPFRSSIRSGATVFAEDLG